MLKLINDYGLNIEDLFSGLTPEEEQPENRDFHINKNPILEKIISNFHNFMHIPLENYNNSFEDLIINYFTPSFNKDVQEFILSFHNFYGLYSKNEHLRYSLEAKIGLFLSSLICSNLSNEIELTLPDFTRIEFLGFKNFQKKLIINGNVGIRLGSQMTSGEIILNGNCDVDFGLYMANGIIRINGDYKENFRGFKDVYGGKIYHYDKLIFETETF